MENQIVIKPTFDAKSVFLASLAVGVSYKIIIYFIIVFGFSMFNLHNQGIANFAVFLPFSIVIILVLGAILFSTYLRSKKHINDNPKLKEDITYVLNRDFFYEKGETFEIKYFWNEVFKVTEKKEFFLIYIKKNVAKIIKKSDLKDNQYNELKSLFNSLDIKKSLK